jgi:glucose/arabinose dehydrogenase
MNKVQELMTFAAAVTVGGGIFASGAALTQSAARSVLEGKAAFTDWHVDRPGLIRHIRPSDIPPANLAASFSNGVRIVRRSANDKPVVPPGFAVSLFAENLDEPRLIRAAPNDDIFVAESIAGRVRVLRPMKSGKPQSEVFARGLDAPFGISFYPAGPDPQWVYVANTNSVVRFPYRAGDLNARGAAETIVPKLPTGGSHWTRDVVFSPDGSKMYVSVGSASNVADGLGKLDRAALAAWTSVGVGLSRTEP